MFSAKEMRDKTEQGKYNQVQTKIFCAAEDGYNNTVIHNNFLTLKVIEELTENGFTFEPSKKATHSIISW